MNIRSRINRLNNMAKDAEDMLEVSYGVWRVRKDGTEYGPTMYVPKSQAKSIGIILLHEPISREEWLEKAKELRENSNNLKNMSE